MKVPKDRRKKFQCYLMQAAMLPPRQLTKLPMQTLHWCITKTYKTFAEKILDMMEIGVVHLALSTPTEGGLGGR